ncbi:hypothetical protein [Mesorhizobium sp.]|uniref:hypothetical protein n=1 Tax=Mesorhizobium sp. TaxID=1871066 RepID=UPI0012178C48|nr:hypothetical protein [Mesorhizobium sp.]TIN06285.1 MAG: hypothetical protein E5Y14_29375 [Mesorhizobium sp.]
MTEEDKPSVTVTLNGDGVIAPALQAIRLATEMVAVCTSAIAATDLNDLPRDGFSGLSFVPHADQAKAKLAYRAWILGKAFQELARGLRATLEQAYIYTLGLREGRKVETWGEFEDIYLAAEKKASSLNFPDLLLAVQAQLATKLDFFEEYRSLQRARNCLEHRNGVVGHIDCDEGAGALSLKLPRLKCSTVSDGEEIEVHKNQYFEKGATIKIKRDLRIRVFALGETVSFTAEEFSEIAMALRLFVADIAPKLPI